MIPGIAPAVCGGGGEYGASGGVETEARIGGVWYRIHTFTSSGTFKATSKLDVKYFIVAGGASGKAGRDNVSGTFPAINGGGAGGIKTNLGGSPVAINAGTYSVTVGNGGAAVDTGPTNRTVVGKAGSSSSFNGVIATGGNGNHGGQGNDPGNPRTQIRGAGAGNGDGTGAQYNFDGTSRYYAGGGGGTSPSGKEDGVHGGGTAVRSSQNNYTAGNGVDNTGGGGGACSITSSGVHTATSGAGGSGIIMIRYLREP